MNGGDEQNRRKGKDRFNLLLNGSNNHHTELSPLTEWFAGCRQAFKGW
jgi:hypothetical protein